MMEDHIFLNFGDKKVSFCIFKRFTWVGESMKPVTLIWDMPVIQEIVMQKSTPDQATPINTKRQMFTKEETHFCYSAGVFINTDPTVLV